MGYMDIKKLTEEYRLHHWAGKMQERQASGMSIRKWCKEERVAEKTYYYWQRKLREATASRLAPLIGSAGQTVAPSGWALCETANGDNDPIAEKAVTIEIGKCRLSADENTDMELFAKVCRVLTSLC